ncbi:MAG: hypothetical protein HY070_09230, partial [Chloroflexi bacterium]|nr:hypothetical protein [Chloroflexota bacterium]
PNATYGIITREDSRTLARLAQIFPNGAITARVFDFAAQPYAAIFRAAGAPTIAPQKNLDARVGDVAQVIGYDLARDGNALALTIYWRARAESREDFTVFAHLVDSREQVIAQDDAPPGHQSYPTSRWRADEIVMDDYRFVLPESLARGEYRVEIGMYILETGARLIVTDANGARMENDRVLLERISLP